MTVWTLGFLPALALLPTLAFPFVVPSSAVALDLPSVFDNVTQKGSSKVNARSVIDFSTFDDNKYRSFLVALNEVAVWSAITVQRLNIGAQEDMDFVSNVLDTDFQDVNERLILQRRYDALRVEILYIGAGHIRFMCSLDEERDCAGNDSLIRTSRLLQTMIICPRFFRSNFRFKVKTLMRDMLAIPGVDIQPTTLDRHHPIDNGAVYARVAQIMAMRYRAQIGPSLGEIALQEDEFRRQQFL